VAKRFRKTAGGGFKRKTAGHKHLSTCKTRKRKRQLRKDRGVSPADINRVRTQIAP